MNPKPQAKRVGIVTLFNQSGKMGAWIPADTNSARTILPRPDVYSLMTTSKILFDAFIFVSILFSITKISEFRIA
jgi:hypothetical protein